MKVRVPPPKIDFDDIRTDSFLEGRVTATSPTVTRCLLCRHTPIYACSDGRFVTTSCPSCHAVLRIEFDPPDQPELRARIERLDDLE